MPPATRAQVESLARELARLDKQLKDRRTPQLTSSSIDDGSLLVRDIEGSTQAVIGKLPDATVGFMPINAAPPPRLSAPKLTVTPRGMAIEWDGLNIDGGDVQPFNWSRCEIHIATSNPFTPFVDTMRGTIESPQGGVYQFVDTLRANPLITPTYTVCFISRNTSGAGSPPSEFVSSPIGQVESYDVADFALTATKFKTTRHVLY